MATVEQTLMKVQRLLTGPMDLRIQVEKNTFYVRFTDLSTVVKLRVEAWGKDREGEPQTLVLVTSLILHGVTPSPALFEWVARQGGSRWFGHVEVHDDEEPGKVLLLMSHTLLGDYLDERELEAAMFGVLSSADAWDDELQKRFGGMRFVDN